VTSDSTSVSTWAASLQPIRAAERLASEAVRELEATGGAVVDAADRPTATAGHWPVPPAIRLAIPAGQGPLTAVLIGPRRDGGPNDPRVVARLEEMSRVVAEAVRLNDPQTGATTS
jgi:hypothetical protein